MYCMRFYQYATLQHFLPGTIMQHSESSSFPTFNFRVLFVKVKLSHRAMNYVQSLFPRAEFFQPL